MRFGEYDASLNTMEPAAAVAGLTTSSVSDICVTTLYPIIRKGSKEEKHVIRRDE